MDFLLTQEERGRQKRGRKDPHNFVYSDQNLRHEGSENLRTEKRILSRVSNSPTCGAGRAKSALVKNKRGIGHADLLVSQNGLGLRLG